MSKPTILITSGNSQCGSATITALRKFYGNNYRIVAGARDPAKDKAKLEALGADSVIEFDFDKPELVKKAVQSGIDRVLHVHGNPTADLTLLAKWSAVMADALKGSSVKYVVRLGGAQGDSKSPHPLVRAQGQADDTFRATGIPYATSGPNFFNENWFGQLDQLKSGTVYGAAGEGSAAYIAVHDIGEVTAHLLNNPEKYQGKHFSLTGPAGISDSHCVEIISKATGKPIKYVNLSVEDLKNALRKKGLPENVVELIAALETVKASKMPGTVSPVVSEILGRPATSFEEWARTNAARFN